MAYSFSLLTRDGSPAHVRSEVERLEKAMTATGGWGCWALSNHDVARVASRWSADGRADPRQARLLLAMLTSLRGSVCLYQGEELGLPEADVPYERLQDPYGITFWPEFKGRDGCRTPMPWQAQAPHGGFSITEPWLPVSAEQTPLAVDVQEADCGATLRFARAWLAWRKTQPAIVHGDIAFFESPAPVLLFERRDAASGAAQLLAFNFTGQPVLSLLPACWAQVVAQHGAPFALGMAGTVEEGALHLPAFGAFVGTLTHPHPAQP
jgi:alpha-glucosidase